MKIPTVGAVKNETLVFINFSAQDASILNISVGISKKCFGILRTSSC